ncbi:MAG: hypothetical protein RSF90_03130 [Pygmaiobacter sp.]
MRLSSEQQRLFWRTFKKVIDVHNLSGTEIESYRHGLLRDATGKTSLTLISPGADFDKVMLYLGRAACDIDVVNQFYNAGMKRAAYKIMENIRRIIGSESARDSLIAYANGILTRRGSTRRLMHSDRWYEDLTEAELDLLLTATSIAAKRRR